MYQDLNDYELIYMIRENNIEYDLIFKKYDYLVRAICNKYLKLAQNAGLEFNDLYNVGLTSLVNAVNKYNENNSLFYTYARICITSKILNYIKVNSGKRRINYSEVINYDDVENAIYSSNIFKDNTNIEFNKNMINNILKEYLYNLDYELMPIFELYINGFTMKDISLLLDIRKTTVSYHVNKFRSDLKVLLS